MTTPWEERRLTILRSYNDGRLSVQAVVKSVTEWTQVSAGFAASSAESASAGNLHPMWDMLCPFYIEDCFEHLSESKMVELLQAMIAIDPRFPLKTSPKIKNENSKTFLFVALCRARSKVREGIDPNDGNTSFNVLRLLIVPGVTDLYSPIQESELYRRRTPLQQASEIPGLNPAVLHRLLDLNPHALRTKSNFSVLPLHGILEAWTPTSDAVIHRMVELAPEALWHPGGGGPGLAPVLYAMDRRTLCPGLARTLQQLVERHPDAAQPGVVTTSGAALLLACRNSFLDVGLIQVIVGTYPQALCLSRIARAPGHVLLPFEAAAAAVARWMNPNDDVEARTVATTATIEFLQQETVEMALAAIEYALQSTTSASAASGGAAAATTTTTSAAPDLTRGSSVSSFDDDNDNLDDDDDDDRDLDHDVAHDLDNHVIDYHYDYHTVCGYSYDYAYAYLNGTGRSRTGDDNDDEATSRLDKFRGRVLAAVSRAVPPSDLTATTIRSGFGWAQALREHEDCLDVCREIFVCPTTSRLLLEDLAFREAVLGKSVRNLYRMNKVGRRAHSSPHHQVRLLALVNDDLDCMYSSGSSGPSTSSLRAQPSECDLIPYNPSEPAQDRDAPRNCNIF